MQKKRLTEILGVDIIPAGVFPGVQNDHVLGLLNDDEWLLNDCWMVINVCWMVKNVVNDDVLVVK